MLIIKIGLGTMLAINGVEYIVCATSVQAAAFGTNKQIEIEAKDEQGNKLTLDFAPGDLALTREQLQPLTVFLTNG